MEPITLYLLYTHEFWAHTHDDPSIHKCQTNQKKIYRRFMHTFMHTTHFFNTHSTMMLSSLNWRFALTHADANDSWTEIGVCTEMGRSWPEYPQFLTNQGIVSFGPFMMPLNCAEIKQSCRVKPWKLETDHSQNHCRLGWWASEHHTGDVFVGC